MLRRMRFGTPNQARGETPQLNIFEYVSCDIHQAPADLPDGQYSLSFEGRTMKIIKSDGHWQSRGVWLASDAHLDGSD